MIQVLLVLLLWTQHYTSSSVPEMSPVECGALFLSVNSLRSLDRLRFIRIRKTAKAPDYYDNIEITWNLDNCKQQDIIPETIALFTSDPEENNASFPLDVIALADFKYNYHVTSVSFKPGTLPGGWDKGVRVGRQEHGVYCLPYWVASYYRGKLIKKNCMKVYPTWMEDAKDDIRDMPLSKVIIPGSHNAGSYAFQLKIQQNAILDKFTLCQDRDLWTQLVSGIRYLDFRIGYYDTSIFYRNTENSQKLWLNHNFIQITPLLPLLEDIRKFLDATTSEIVILDIHQLPVGFYESNGDIISDRHQQLLDVLGDMFRDHINHYSETMFRAYRATGAGPTIADILDTGKRLVIGYPERKIYSENKWVWPSVRHMWANTNDPYELKKYLDGVMSNPPLQIYPVSTPLWSAMAETTPSIGDMVKGRSIRQQAEAVNRNLTTWLRSSSWWTKANIIASDFYLANNLIDEAVYYNTIKGRLSSFSLSNTN